jgi:hypothetical protein
MMKFFRKYNKHLLAVFMALLLVIWLGGTAVEEFVRPDPSKRVLGSALGGEITQGEIDRAKIEGDLLAPLGMSWQGLRDRVGVRGPVDSDESLGSIDWVLLKREARRMGGVVSPERAEELLSGPIPGAEGDTLEAQIRRYAAKSNIRTDAIYQAASGYFSVLNTLQLYQSACVPPEPQLRRMARDISEQATIDAIIFPAASFDDPAQTFSEQELTAQFNAHKEAEAGPGLNFGYYVQPKVKIQYIRVDPQLLKEHLRGSEKAMEREAYQYWQANRETAPEFRWTQTEIAELKDRQDADSSGVAVPELGSFYTDFAQARDKALNTVKLNTAKAEADRVANRLLQALREPWFSVTYDDTGHKPAPEDAASEAHYEEVVATLPANMQYAEGIVIKTLDWTAREDLTGDFDPFVRAGVTTADNQFIRPSQLAFDVQGLTEAPEEMRRDTSAHLSLWQTFPQTLVGLDNALYVFRVIAVAPGHVPEDLTEVADRVAEDLRTLAGMQAARARAQALVDNIGTTGLREAWMADEALRDEVTADQGGYVEPPPFPRDSTAFGLQANRVQPFGVVTDEFIETAFELAKAGPDAGVKVIELPDAGQGGGDSRSEPAPALPRGLPGAARFLPQQPGRAAA